MVLIFKSTSCSIQAALSKILRALFLIQICLLSGCAGPISLSPSDPSYYINNSLKSDTWNIFFIRTPQYSLLSAGPTSIPSKTLRIYFEGDGHAWEDRNTPSTDPTPLDPIALRLALADPSPSSVYIARPCQYPKLSSTANCKKSAWTNERFSDQIVRETNLAIDQLKTKYGADWLVFIGYSGGGTIAALCASKRNDVSLLATVAGNLSTDAWVNYHGLSPLIGSLNPLDSTVKLESIKQIHFVGSEDDIVPPFLAMEFVSYFPENSKPSIKIEKGFSHSEGWVKNWSKLAP